MKTTFFRLLAATATALLLHFSWPTTGFIFFIFIAFLPLLWVENQVHLGGGKRVALKVFGYSYFTFALFNLIATMWVKNAHVSGPIATTFVNGALMATVFLLYHLLKKRLGFKRAIFTFPFLWICLEVFHQDWDMSFPWLDLGNAFADKIEWVQWYEYLGHMGGSLWVLLANVAFFHTLIHLQKKNNRQAIVSSVLGVVIIFTPILIGKRMYNNYVEQGFAVDVVAIQPNIEAFTEKFVLGEEEQTSKFLALAAPLLDSNVDLLVGPETLLGHGIEEKNLKYNSSVMRFIAMVDTMPHLNILFGITSYNVFTEAEKTPISIPFRNSDLWYEIYNASVQVNESGLSPIYHKSKLVVGAEQMPFRWILQPLLGKIVVDLGGMTGTHGTQEERSHFVSGDGRIKSATIICWEAEFGEYCTGFAKSGANIFLAITNDGWWGDTDGHRQHLHYARLRAVENRRAVARSANTGISAFINQRGDISQAQPWAADGAIRGELIANENLTFYTKNGDLIGRLALFISAIMLLVLITVRFRKR